VELLPSVKLIMALLVKPDERRQLCPEPSTRILNRLPLMPLGLELHVACRRASEHDFRSDVLQKPRRICESNKALICIATRPALHRLNSKRLRRKLTPSGMRLPAIYEFRSNS